MSTTGILRPDEVVFYHPLDNFIESTKGQAWPGTGGFTTGKIGLANSAVTADAAAWGSITTVDMEGHDQGRGSIIKLTSTTAVVAYTGTNGVDVSTRVATVSGGTVTVGPEYVAASNGNGTGKAPLGAALSSTKIIMCWRSSGATFSVIVGTVSGTDITFGTAWSTMFGWPAAGFAVLSSTRAIMVYGIYSPAYETLARVVEVSGTDMTFGSTVQLKATAGSIYGACTVGLDSTRAVVAWNEGTSIETAVLTMSGTNVTVAGQVTLAASGSIFMDVVFLVDDKVAYAWQNGPVQDARVANVSGTNITLGTAVQAQTGVNHSGLGALSSTTFVVCGASSFAGGSRFSRICTVSGLDITVGGSSSTTATVYFGGATEALSATSFLHMTTDELVPGVIGQEASMIALTPVAYPVAIGDDRVVVAMWARNVTKGSSTVTVQRDYAVGLYGDTVTLGPASVVWSGVAALGAGQMNDDSDHLLVLDFEHAGGGSWNLRTSFDGGTWVDEGAGTGTRSTAPASLAPGLSIVDGEVGQWIDELIVWSGDKTLFDIFTSEELANLYDLAESFDEGMSQYEENYGAPICWQATARMPDGSVWRDSGSGPCPATIRAPKGAADVVVTDDGMPASPHIIQG